MKKLFHSPQDSNHDIWADWLAEDKKNTSPDKSLEPHYTYNQHTSKAIKLGFKGSQQAVRAPLTSKQTNDFQHIPPSPKPYLPKAQKPKDKHSKVSRSITFNVSLPEVKRIRDNLSTRKFKIVGCSVLLIMALVVIPLTIFGPDKSGSTIVKSSAGGKTVTKDFAELLPAQGDNVKNKRFDSSKGFYAFNDIYKGSNLTISEQPLPDSFRDNPREKGKQLANSANATDAYETTAGTLYLNSSDQKTAERAVLVHRQLLIFIQGTLPLTVTEWVQYVQSLQ